MTSFWQLQLQTHKIRVVLLAPLMVLVIVFYATDSFPLFSNTGTGTSATSSTSTSKLDELYASTPFCNVDGICGESPTIPSPRTKYSAKSVAQQNQWMEFHHQLNQNATKYAAAVSTAAAIDNKDKKRRPLILLGDSITEAWIGTSYGTTAKRARGIPEVFRETLLQEWPSILMDPPPLVLAISGDQTQHLLWRMQNGNLLPSYTENPKSIYVVLIGTNNLGAGELPGPTAEGIMAVVQYLLDHTLGKIVVLEVLPRGDGDEKLPDLCPPRCQSNGQPYPSFLPAVDKVNAAIRSKLTTTTSMDREKRVVAVSCGSQFLLQDDDDKTTRRVVDTTLFSDRLHPNVAGQRLLAKCIQQGIEQIVNQEK